MPSTIVILGTGGTGGTDPGPAAAMSPWQARVALTLRLLAARAGG